MDIILNDIILEWPFANRGDHCGHLILGTRNTLLTLFRRPQTRRVLEKRETAILEDVLAEWLFWGTSF